MKHGAFTGKVPGKGQGGQPTLLMRVWIGSFGRVSLPSGPGAEDGSYSSLMLFFGCQLDMLKRVGGLVIGVEGCKLEAVLGEKRCLLPAGKGSIWSLSFRLELEGP